MGKKDLLLLAKLIRKWILESTTRAGSGHVTSSLSAVELMVGLMFGGFFRYRIEEPDYANNDRLIFSKGHASPLFYALWAAAGGIEPEELLSLRRFESRLEGHPTMEFPFTEAPTGSLGQGLAIGVGMALGAKMDELPFRTFVLLGDSEMSEGSNWEALALAAHYKLNNLVGIVDVNRLGQTGATMSGHDLKPYAARAEAFGWNAIMLEDGHEFNLVMKALEIAQTAKEKPTMLIAKTLKGKGVSLLENKEGWHGKALNLQQLDQALKELGEVEEGKRGVVGEPEKIKNQISKIKMTGQNSKFKEYLDGGRISTRRAFGEALVGLGEEYGKMVVVDAEVGNSTYTELFGNTYPERFAQSFIAEQAMVGMGVGLARRGKRVVMSTFSAFLIRAHDQLRMAGYAGLPLVVAGTHAGVSIGEDGVSQMGLEDIAMMRTVFGSVVVYPADHVSTEKMVKQLLEYPAISYMRLTRETVDSLYGPEEEFCLGGSKTLKTSEHDQVTVIGAGVTLYEALEAYEQLREKGVLIRVIDLYSIKPIDVETLVIACKETRALIVVEDHFEEGGMAEAVRSALIYETTPIHSLAVRKMPRSGTMEELLSYEEIDAEAIVRKVKEIVG